MFPGLRLDAKKEASLVSWAIRRPPPPSKVRIPLQLDPNRASVACVRVGEHVRVGQVIALPKDAQSVSVHASISGQVEAIGIFPHPVLGEAQAIEIRSDGRNERMPEIGRERPAWQTLAKDEILQLLQDSGVVGLRGLIPAHVKNARPKQGRIHTLILNACESEPYVTCDHALMMSQPLEVLKGAEMIRALLEAQRVIVAIEDNKLEAAEVLKSKIYFLKWKQMEVRIFPARYPQGAVVPLLRSVLGLDPIRLAQGALVSIQVHNVATALAVYEAIVLQKPLYERAVTVGGECVAESRNVWVPIGTTFEETFKFCKGLLREPYKVLMGGPMQGLAQPHLNVPVVPSTQAILALPKEVAYHGEEVQPCIRCNRCVEACPVEISPVMITLAAEKDFFEVAEDWGLSLCIECGNCTYVCPSRRPMTELIRYAKRHTGRPAHFPGLCYSPGEILAGRQAIFQESLEPGSDRIIPTQENPAYAETV